MGRNFRQGEIFPTGEGRGERFFCSGRNVTFPGRGGILWQKCHIFAAGLGSWGGNCGGNVTLRGGRKKAKGGENRG